MDTGVRFVWGPSRFFPSFIVHQKLNFFIRIKHLNYPMTTFCLFIPQYESPKWPYGCFSFQVNCYISRLLSLQTRRASYRDRKQKFSKWFISYDCKRHPYTPTTWFLELYILAVRKIVSFNDFQLRAYTSSYTIALQPCQVMSLSCHSESLIYKTSSFWVMRDIIRPADPKAFIVLIFLCEVSSSVRNIIIWDIMVIYKTFSNRT